MAEPHRLRAAAQIVAAAIGAQELPQHPATLAATRDAAALIAAAEAQVGVTVRYDPSYVGLAFPGGDVPSDRGVCTDVLIRALRASHGIDLQAAVNRDMRTDFAAYPRTWGLSRPDANIDHRRVPNLERLFERLGATVAPPGGGNTFLPGDIVTSRLPGNLPHVMIVTARAAAGGAPMVVHNIGAGTRVEDALLDHPIAGHYRLTPAVLGALRTVAAE